MRVCAYHRARMKRMNIFERYLSLWVALCMVAGVIIGKLMPASVRGLERLKFGTGSHINIPMAVHHLVDDLSDDAQDRLRVDRARRATAEGADHHRGRELAGEAVLDGV